MPSQTALSACFYIYNFCSCSNLIKVLFGIRFACTITILEMNSYTLSVFGCLIRFLCVLCAPEPPFDSASHWSITNTADSVVPCGQIKQKLGRSCSDFFQFSNFFGLLVSLIKWLSIYEYRSQYNTSSLSKNYLNFYLLNMYEKSFKGSLNVKIKYSNNFFYLIAWY